MRNQIEKNNNLQTIIEFFLLFLVFIHKLLILEGLRSSLSILLFGSKSDSILDFFGIHSDIGTVKPSFFEKAL